MIGIPKTLISTSFLNAPIPMLVGKLLIAVDLENGEQQISSDTAALTVLPKCLKFSTFVSTRCLALPHYNAMVWKFSCLIHVVLLTDHRPNFNRAYRMNGLLKRFNRH